MTDEINISGGPSSAQLAKMQDAAMSRHYTKMMREQAKLGAALEKHTLAALANQKKVESSTGLPLDLIRALEALKPSIAGVTHVQGMRQSYMREQTKIINQAHAENEKYDKSRWNMFKQEAIEEDRRRTKEKRRQYEFSQDYFRNQEFSRLGHKGAQAVNTGGLRELIKIDRHLSGMEHTLDRFAKTNGLTPQEQEARRKSARETLARSYSQISAAAAEAPGIKGFLARAIVTNNANKARIAAGLTPFSSGYGSGGIAGKIGRGALGGLGIGLEALDALGPIAGTIGAIGLGVYETPRLISGAMNKIYQGAKPYYNLQNFAGTYGLAGGISGRSIMSSLMPGNKLSPSWMTKYGLTQQDVMARVSQYGIAPTSLSQLQNMALMPSLMKYSGSLAGLSDDQRYAANKSFLLSGGNTGKQWTQLQRIMTTAVADGADLASVNRAILATMQQGAAAGAIFNGTGVAGIYNRVLSSGAAGGKTGALETTITSAISSTLDNPGGSIMSAMPLYAYIKSHGGAHATAKSLLGKYYNSFTKTGQGQEIIAALNNAQGNPFVQIQMLGAAFKGHLSTALGIYSNYYSPEGPGRRELALGSSIGITPLVGTAIYGGGTGSPPASAASAVKAAAKATGVDPNVLTALFGGEDALGRGGVGNGGGLGQMTAGALKAVGMAGANMNDPATAAKASALYYKKMYALFKNVKNRKQRMEDAFLAYNMGPGYASQIENGTLPSTIMVNGREIHPYANLANKMKYFTGFSSSSSSTSANTSLAQAGNVNKVNAAAADTQAAKNIADTLGKAIQHYAGTLFHVQHAAMEVTNATISVAAADFRNLGSYSDMLNPSAFGISPHKPLKNP